MKCRHLPWVVGAVMVATVGCDSEQSGGMQASPCIAPLEVAPVQRPSGAAGVVIAVVKTRDEAMTLRSTEAGLKVDVVGEGGRLVGDSMTLDDLRTKHEGLHTIMHRGVADRGDRTW